MVILVGIDSGSKILSSAVATAKYCSVCDKSLNTDEVLQLIK